jgi:hypothetical protein
MRTFRALHIGSCCDPDIEFDGCGHKHLTPAAALRCGRKNLNPAWTLAIKASDNQPITKADWKLTTAAVREINWQEMFEATKEYMAEEQAKKSAKKPVKKFGWADVYASAVATGKRGK